MSVASQHSDPEARMPLTNVRGYATLPLFYSVVLLSLPLPGLADVRQRSVGPDEALLHWEGE